MHELWSRYSCRRFAPESIPRETVLELLDAARWAANAGNLQPWRFLVVETPGARQALAGAALGQGFIAEAPLVVVVCAVPEESARVYGQRGRELYCLQDCAAATQNLLLAAAAAGLGSCWVGAFRDPEVARVLDLPAEWRPVAIVPLGRPLEPTPERSRRPLGEVVLWR
jgi:nitroreductase